MKLASNLDMKLDSEIYVTLSNFFRIAKHKSGLLVVKWF
jgi:hypothetical protein